MKQAQPLVFQDITFSVIDRAGAPWLRSHQIGDAFGYKQPKAALNLYAANADEFTSDMTAVIDMKTKGGAQAVRIFSLRGAHLLGMFARTERAKEFRKWVLNVLESYGKDTPVMAALPAPAIDKDAELAIKQRAKVLADSFYPLYCLQMRHAVKSGQLAAAHVPSWLPTGHPTQLTIGLSGKPSARLVIAYDHTGKLLSHREMKEHERIIDGEALWELSDQIRKFAFKHEPPLFWKPPIRAD